MSHKLWIINITSLLLVKSRIGNVNVENGFPHLGMTDRLMISMPQFKATTKWKTWTVWLREKWVTWYTTDRDMAEQKNIILWRNKWKNTYSMGCDGEQYWKHWCNRLLQDSCPYQYFSKSLQDILYSRWQHAEWKPGRFLPSTSPK